LQQQRQKNGVPIETSEAAAAAAACGVSSVGDQDSSSSSLSSFVAWCVQQIELCIGSDGCC